MIQLQFPQVKLLPFDNEACFEYAKKSREYFKNYNPSWDKRSQKEKMNDTYAGAIGEEALMSMLSENNVDRVWDLPMWRGGFDSFYDILVHDGFRFWTIDVKTTIKYDRVPTPQKCNFGMGLSQLQPKVEKNTLCDIYVQMFFDPDEDMVYFIGAISGNEIKRRYIENDWDLINRGYRVISSQNMDFTVPFKAYFRPIVKEDVMASLSN